jgi:hypothetical protein
VRPARGVAGQKFWEFSPTPFASPEAAAYIRSWVEWNTERETAVEKKNLTLDTRDGRFIYVVEKFQGAADVWHTRVVKKFRWKDASTLDAAEKYVRKHGK